MNTKPNHIQAAEEQAFETKEVDIFGLGSEVFPYLHSVHIEAVDRASEWPHPGCFMRDIRGHVDDESIKYLVRHGIDKFIRGKAIKESEFTLVSGVGLVKTKDLSPKLKASRLIQEKPKLEQLGGTGMGSKLLSDAGLPDVKCKFVCSLEAARDLGSSLDGVEVVVDHEPIRLAFGKGGYKTIEPKIIVKHKGEEVAVPNPKFLNAKYEVGVLMAGDPILIDYTNLKNGAKTLVRNGFTCALINMPSTPKCIPVIYRR